MGTKKKACIIVDSSSGIKNGELENVYMIPLHIIRNSNGVQTQYKDLEEITTPEIIKMLGNKDKLQSSQSSLGEIILILEELVDKYETIYVWPISKGLSSSYNTWIMAKDDFSKYDINIIDSGHINMGIKHHVTHMVKMINENKTKKEILEYVNFNQNNWRGVLSVNDVTQLKNGGRINFVKALLVSALKLNILIEYDGKLEYFDKEKDILKSIDKMINFIDSKINFREKGIKRSYLYTTYTDEEKNNELKKIVSDKINFQIEDVYYFPAVIALHTGAKTFAIFIETN